MKRGAILFAFNSPKFDYYKMAVYTAKRINHFLDLPVTVVTDLDSLPYQRDYNFDETILIEPDKSNKRDWGIWINKGRYQAYELSPYDETLLLDTDYMVNSNRLLKTFEYSIDFCCHDTTSFLLRPGVPQEYLSSYSYKTLWATVVAFRKTKRAEQIFQCLEMVQKNFNHYSFIHNFIGGVYRNDYALTLALRIANGHAILPGDIIPWNLNHVGKDTRVHKNSNDEFNTEFVIMGEKTQKGKTRTEYLTIKDTDFHVMKKDNFMELIV